MDARTLGKLFAAGFLSLAAITAVLGCERKEKVIDVETPAGEVEVERNKDTGEVDVEVERKRE